MAVLVTTVSRVVISRVSAGRIKRTAAMGVTMNVNVTHEEAARSNWNEKRVVIVYGMCKVSERTGSATVEATGHADAMGQFLQLARDGGYAIPVATGYWLPRERKSGLYGDHSYLMA